jgi:hypothetical protein
MHSGMNAPISLAVLAPVETTGPQEFSNRPGTVRGLCLKRIVGVARPFLAGDWAEAFNAIDIETFLQRRNSLAAITYSRFVYLIVCGYKDVLPPESSRVRQLHGRQKPEGYHDRKDDASGRMFSQYLKSTNFHPANVL